MSPLTASLPRARTTFVTTLLLVFLSGTVVGGLVMSLGGHTALHKAAFWTVPGREASLQNLKKELDLTPAQTDQLETILDDFAKYYRDVLSDGKSRIFQILNDEQKRKFEKMLEAQDRRR
jgi:hypothetical protein